MKYQKTIFLGLTSMLLISLTSFYQTESADRKEIVEYSISLSIERGNTEETIRTYIENDSLFADIESRKYLDPTGKSGDINIPNYYDQFGLKRLLLSDSQIDSLRTFRDMVQNNTIRHNLGLKIAGRLGRYEIIDDQNNLEIESRNLYSLITALNLKK